MREKLAELCHSQWSGWMEYLFSKCNSITPIALLTLEAGSLIIPAEFVERWKRQAAAPYSELSESEQNSDREEAAKFYKLMNQTMHATNIFYDWFANLREHNAFDISAPDIFVDLEAAAECVRERKLLVHHADGGFTGYVGLVKDLPKLLMYNLSNINWEDYCGAYNYTGSEEFFSASEINGPELLFFDVANLVGEQGLLNWQIKGYSVQC